MTDLNDAQDQTKMAFDIWKEFGAMLQKQLPDLNDLLVLAATKVAREHFNPRNGNVDFKRSMTIMSEEDTITITIKK